MPNPYQYSSLTGFVPELMWGQHAYHIACLLSYMDNTGNVSRHVFTTKAGELTGNKYTGVLLLPYILSS